MVSHLQKKIDIKKQIIAALNRDTQASMRVILASLSLEHGYTEATIKKIFEQLETIGVIKIENDAVILIGIGAKD